VKGRRARSSRLSRPFVLRPAIALRIRLAERNARREFFARELAPAERERGREGEREREREREREGAHTGNRIYYSTLLVSRDARAFVARLIAPCTREDSRKFSARWIDTGARVVRFIICVCRCVRWNFGISYVIACDRARV